MKTEETSNTNESTPARSRFIVVVVTAMLVVSVVLNVMLALKIRGLNGYQTAARAERELKVGTTVPAISANRVDGAKETISYVGTDRPTVLYIFTPECKWCLRNLDNLRTLVDQKGKEYRFIGISLSGDGLEQYLSVHNLALPVYTDVPKETGEMYKMGGTPQTVVISPQGQVMQNWVGAYVGDQKSEVEKFFKVTLPGISPNS